MSARHAVIAIRQLEKNTGASRVAFSQAALLRQAGYRVTLLAERANEALVAERDCELVRLWRWPLRGAFRRQWFNLRVQAWCRRHHPDLLISHGDAETPNVLFLHNCVHLASQKIHGKPLPAGHEVALLHDRILSAQAFDVIGVNSRMMGDEVIRRYGIPADKVRVFHPGYDAGQFNTDDRAARRLAGRAAVGVDPSATLVGLVTSGDFSKRNVAGFIDAAAKLVALAPDRDWRFLVVGKDRFDSYRQQAERLGIGNRVIHSPVMDNVAMLYPALDLFVLPAHIEEFGLVALEAMACGTPVLLGDHVGASELLPATPEWQQRILPAADSTRWAEAIRDSVADQAGSEARALVLASQLGPWQYAQQQAAMQHFFEQIAAAH